MSVVIEFQDITGIWKRIQTNVSDNSQIIQTRMNEVKRMYPKSKVRAVDEKTGRLIDLLN